MKGFYQHDANDCGVACIASLGKMLGYTITIENVRKCAYLDRDGMNLYGMTKTAEKFYMDLKAYQLSEDEFRTEKWVRPFIAMINKKEGSHYIVVERINNKKITVWDPEEGNKRYNLYDFQKIFSGYVLIVESYCKDISLKKEKNRVHYYFGKSKWKIVLIIGLSILETLFSLKYLSVYREVVDSTSTFEYGTLGQLGVKLIIINLVILDLYKVKQKQIIRLNYDLKKGLKKEFVESIVKIPNDNLNGFQMGDITDRFMGIDNVVENGINMVITIVIQTFTLVFSAIILMKINVELFFIIMLFSFFEIMLYFMAKKMVTVSSRKFLNIHSEVITFLKEYISNVVAIKTMTYAGIIKNFNQKINAEEKQSYQLDKKIMHTQIFGNAIESMLSIIILMYGVYLVVQGKLTIGILFLFESYMQMFMEPLKSMVKIIPDIQTLKLTIHRLQDIYMCYEDKCNNMKLKKNVPDDRKEWRFLNISVAYGYSVPTFENVNMALKSGEKYYIVGKSGTGKSTLGKVMAGINNVEKGSIFYNGRNITNATCQERTKYITYLTQESQLFSASIRDNITMWNDEIDKEKLEKVMNICGIYQMIKNKGVDLDTKLQENGANLSGGERQRIMLARVLMRDSDTYIFDEATSHLDKESEIIIMKEVDKLLGSKTQIIITHHLDLIKEEDNIVFIDNDGNIVVDTHHNLQNNSKKYREFLKS